MSGEETIKLLTNKSVGPGEFSSFKNSLNKVNTEYNEPSGNYYKHTTITVSCRGAEATLEV